MSDLAIRPARGLLGRRVFIDVPFRIFGKDPTWIPPLRLSVYDRLSPRHPAMAHQKVALWVAYRQGQPVGRIGACIDSYFNHYQREHWGWLGFFDAFDDTEAAQALFDAAWSWCKAQGAELAVGPASFTTNDELGLQVDGFDVPPTILTLQNPPYYEKLWLDAGWEQAMDLWAFEFDRLSTALSDRQRRTLDRLRARAGVHARSVRLDDWDSEITRFFDVYNAAWSRNWGFAPLPEAEVRHLAKQVKQIMNPDWLIGLENAKGDVVGVCVCLPDVNQLMRGVRSGRLFPTGWIPLLLGKKKVNRVRVWALGIRPDYENRGLGPLLYQELVDRVGNIGGIPGGEASWTLSTNHRINKQLQALGGRHSKTWRLYRHAL